MTSLTAGLAVLIGVFLAVKFTTDLIRERRRATLSGRFRSSTEQPPQIRSGLHFSSYFVTPQTSVLDDEIKDKIDRTRRNRSPPRTVLKIPPLTHHLCTRTESVSRAERPNLQ